MLRFIDIGFGSACKQQPEITTIVAVIVARERWIFCCRFRGRIIKCLYGYNGDSVGETESFSTNGDGKIGIAEDIYLEQ